MRLKNGIARVDGWLEELGWKPRQRAERLESVTSLLEDHDFWQHQAPGLGILVDDDGRVTDLRLAEAPEQRAVVSDVYHLRPLWPSLELVDLPVLALTRDKTRLYLMSGGETRPMDADLPSYPEVNWFVDREKQRQQHPDAAGSKAARHGHEPSLDRDEDLDRFLRAVIDNLPRLDGSMLVLGDDRLVARFEDISPSPTVTTPNTGLEDADDVQDVAQKAAPALHSREEANERLRSDVANEALGKEDAITEVDEALEAAVAGGLSALVLGRDAEPLWGRFDPSTLQVARREDQGLLDVDLLDRLLVHATATGAESGTVATRILGYSFVGVRRF